MLVCLLKHGRLLLLCSIINIQSFKTQVNLVLNPSFEQLDSCPNAGFQINKASFWGNINNNLPCISSLMHSCSTNTLDCGIPIHGLGGLPISYQWPRTGNGYCVMHTFSPPPPPFTTNFRYYTIGTLSTYLINGKVYCGKLYINLDSGSPYKINRFGMYFDNGTVIGAQTTCLSILGVSSHIDNNPLIILSDTLGWMKIEGMYIANGTENRITIGNFYSDALTIGIPTGFPTGFGNAIYNIDDISLIPMDITAFAGNDVTICLSDTLNLGRPQEVGLECLWYTPSNSTPFSASSNFTFKPTQTGTYTFIQKMDNCQISFDTVTVTVIEDCNSLLEIPNVFTPNNDNTNDTWHFQLKNTTLVNFTLYNRWGLIIKSDEIKTHNYFEWDGRTTSGEPCSAGVYFYTLQYTDANGDTQKKNWYITLIK